MSQGCQTSNPYRKQIGISMETAQGPGYLQFKDSSACQRMANKCNSKETDFFKKTESKNKFCTFYFKLNFKSSLIRIFV